MSLRCLDLFCGAGGLSLGFMNAGYEVVAGIDNDEEALGTFKKNHASAKAIQHDLAKSLIDSKQSIIKELLSEKIDLIIGGPPCQGMSIAGKRLVDDPRNTLYKAYIKTIEHFNPKAIVLENVPTITSLFNGKIAAAIINDFERHGYFMSMNTIFASDYGVPQKRKRTVFVGLKNSFFVFPEPTTKYDPISCEEAIGDLPLLEECLGSEEMDYPTGPLCEYQREIRGNSKKIYNHIAVEHKKRTLEIISMVPDGGNYKNLPLNLQDIRKVHIAWTRMNSKKPSFTIDAGHNHHFHYKANRVPTVRECARLQSFPDTFKFYGKRTSQYKQVGNAVPPLLAKQVAIRIKEQLDV